MQAFELKLSVNLIFGRGTVSQVGRVAGGLGRRALIVTGRSSARTGALAAVTDRLEASGLKWVLFDRVRANPLTTTVMEGAEEARRENCDLVIGLGGGSPMDAAKAVAFMAVNPGHINDYVFGDKSGDRALPLVAVSTTAGTGSEMDRYAVVTDPETRGKKSLKSPAVYPIFSIVDPELMYSLPPAMIAATGFDAFSHALEALLSPLSSPLSEMVSLEAVRLISRHLPLVFKESGNRDSWDFLAWGNCLGGWAIDLAGVGPIHGLEHPVSGLLGVTHGEGLAALTGPVLKITADYSGDKFEKAALAMDGPWRKSEDLIPALEVLLERLALKLKLSDLGVKEGQIDWLAENALATNGFALGNSHHPGLERDTLKKILSEAF